MVGYIILAIIIVVAIYIAASYNGLVKLRNLVEEAFSTMDVYLKKRWDLIPNLVETVKGYMSHEKDTFEKITALRTESYDSMPMDKKINVNEQLSQSISRLLAVAENYPDLKASQNFSELNANLTKIEEDIANSRKYYNGAVRSLNNKVEMFPSNIVANMFGFKKAKMFEAKEEEKENVKVEF